MAEVDRLRIIRLGRDMDRLRRRRLSAIALTDQGGAVLEVKLMKAAARGT
jgi:hypothetical protein